MKKSKISMMLLSVLAVTSLASCNIEQPAENSKKSSADVTTSISDDSQASIPSGDTSGGENVDLVSISLNKASTEIMVESTEQLSVTFNPANASDKAVTWSSNNPAVATVNNGLVTAVKTGDAVITVSSTNNPNINASCNVKVVDNVIVSNVDANTNSFYLIQIKQNHPVLMMVSMIVHKLIQLVTTMPSTSNQN